MTNLETLGDQNIEQVINIGLILDRFAEKLSLERDDLSSLNVKAYTQFEREDVETITFFSVIDIENKRFLAAMTGWKLEEKKPISDRNYIFEVVKGYSEQESRSVFNLELPLTNDPICSYRIVHEEKDNSLNVFEIKRRSPIDADAIAHFREEATNLDD